MRRLGVLVACVLGLNACGLKLGWPTQDTGGSGGTTTKPHCPSPYIYFQFDGELNQLGGSVTIVHGTTGARAYRTLPPRAPAVQFTTAIPAACYEIGLECPGHGFDGVDVCGKDNTVTIVGTIPKTKEF